MRFYLKAVFAYARSVLFLDEDDKNDSYKSNVFKRYAYYTLDDLMIVNPSTGRYERYPMPAPFCWPGKIGWKAVHIWQTKIVKTHL